MLDALRKRRDEEGFTLIELMVVVLIIGILVAIAVPTFLRAQENAKSKAATSNLRASLSAVKTYHAENESYTIAAPGDLKAVEPSLAWQTGASDEPQEIMYVSDTDTIALGNKSKAGYCYFIIDDVSTSGGTRYGKSNATTSGDCTAHLTAASVTPASTFADSAKAAGW